MDFGKRKTRIVLPLGERGLSLANIEIVGGNIRYFHDFDTGTIITE